MTFTRIFAENEVSRLGETLLEVPSKRPARPYLITAHFDEGAFAHYFALMERWLTDPNCHVLAYKGRPLWSMIRAGHRDEEKKFRAFGKRVHFLSYAVPRENLPDDLRKRFLRFFER